MSPFLQRFWDEPHDGQITGVTPTELVDRLTAYLEQQQLLWLKANVYLRLRIADHDELDRAWRAGEFCDRLVSQYSGEKTSELVLPIKTASAQSGVPWRAVYRAISNGTLAVVHIPGRLKPGVRLSDLERLKAARDHSTVTRARRLVKGPDA